MCYMMCIIYWSHNLGYIYTNYASKGLKKRNIYYIYTLSRLYNECIELGKFPDFLKISRITPIFKKGSKELLENYRPVSTLPIFGKILKKLYTVDCTDSLLQMMFLVTTSLVFVKVIPLAMLSIILLKLSRMQPVLKNMPLVFLLTLVKLSTL